MSAVPAFVPAVEPPAQGSETAWWLAFREGELLAVREDGRLALPGVPPAQLGLSAERPLYLGTLDGRDCYAARLDASAEPPPGLELVGLRALYGQVDDARYALAGRAFQLLEWDRTHRFCGACGTPTEALPGERAMRCPRCGHLSFPRLSPAVIMLVRRGPRVLLARGRGFRGRTYSVLAGFVEPGESLEEAVRREVREEVGLEVERIRYFGSQPWPFPHQLMIGFTAVSERGEIRIDEREIVDAGWFEADSLPDIPHPLSIARSLIDSFLAEQAVAGGG